jgi:hypothetical protein
VDLDPVRIDNQIPIGLVVTATEAPTERTKAPPTISTAWSFRVVAFRGRTP